MYYAIIYIGYPLRPWLMTAILHADDDSPEERYNTHFKSVRSIIERCNGVLKARFRCLLKHRVLHYSPPKCVEIIIACCVLHNICVMNNVDLPDDEEIEIDNGVGQNLQVNNIQNQRNQDLLAGRAIRQEIVETFTNV